MKRIILRKWLIKQNKQNKTENKSNQEEQVNQPSSLHLVLVLYKSLNLIIKQEKKDKKR
jgi:hypothetical protein